MSQTIGGVVTIVLMVILLIAVVVLGIMVVSLTQKVNKLNKRFRLLMKGDEDQSLEKALLSRLRETEKLQEKVESTSHDVRAMNARMHKAPLSYGIVKYDAFEDVGGKMSFALAMLDQENTGFVLNAIHSRDNCFLYLKEIVKSESYIMLSDEEIAALRQAAAKDEDEQLAE